MNKKNTSIRLKEIMAERNLKQVDILKLAQPYSEKYNVKLNKSDISQYISGKTEPGQDKLFILGMALNVNESWLMGFDVPKERYSVQNSPYLEQQQFQEQKERMTNLFAGIPPLNPNICSKDAIQFLTDTNIQDPTLKRLLAYVKKIAALSADQQNIIYGMIDNMKPTDDTLLAAHEDDNVSEEDKISDIEMLRKYKSNKKDN